MSALTYNDKKALEGKTDHRGLIVVRREGFFLSLVADILVSLVLGSVVQIYQLCLVYPSVSPHDIALSMWMCLCAPRSFL